MKGFSCRDLDQAGRLSGLLPGHCPVVFFNCLW